jgi:hypothetical protein
MKYICPNCSGDVEVKINGILWLFWCSKCDKYVKAVKEKEDGRN